MIGIRNEKNVIKLINFEKIEIFKIPINCIICINVEESFNNLSIEESSS